MEPERMIKKNEILCQTFMNAVVVVTVEESPP